MSDSARPCTCESYDPACTRAGRPMTRRDYELCSGRCPPGRPCPGAPNSSEDFRRKWDGLPPLDYSTGKRTLPCVHRGETAGEVICPSCKGRVALKVFSCAKHGECTLSKPAGKPCCATCGDYESHQHTQRAGEVRNLVFHFYPRRGNGIWQWHVAQLRKRRRLFNGRCVVAIATDASTDSPDDVKALFEGWPCEFIEMPNNAGLREVATLEPLLERVENLSPAQATFYAHAKGVTYPDARSRPITELHYETCLDYWPLVEELLRDHPVAGSFRVHDPNWFPGQSTSDWFYMGSFFWFRNKDLFRQPDWRRADPFWCGVETYPSLHFSFAEAASIFYTRRHDSLAETEIVAWRKEHAHQRKEW